MSNSVSIKNVSKHYGNFVAVDNVSLEIRDGEFLSLLGSSGAGKTTILQMIAGFTQVDSGSISIGSQDITYTPSHKRSVNTVFQDYSLFPHMTVADNVAYGLRQDGVPSDERRTRVKEALEMIEMQSMANRKPDELSGGQQQRVALARALVKRPMVLLLDEPLGALDRRLRQQMQVELKQLQRDIGITFVFVTHDQEEALAMSDRIVVMRGGKIEQIGTPNELYDQPESAFVAGFVGDQNFLKGNFIPADNTLITDDGIIITASCITQGVNKKAIAAVRPENISLSNLEPNEQSNKAPGTIFQIVHLGNILKFVIRMASGLEISCRQARKSAPGFNIGDKVWLAWSQDDTAIFPADPQIEALMMRSA